MLLDDEFEAETEIIKQDDETKKQCSKKKNTEFKIFNMDTENMWRGNNLSDYGKT